MDNRANLNPKKHFLITGCGRSGTTLLASMIGMHPQCVTIHEEHECEVFSKTILGDKIVGLKAPMPRMGLTKSASLAEIQIFRQLLRFTRKHVMHEGCYRYSVDDFLQANCKIIFITRDTQANVDSIIKRAGYSEKRARREIAYALNVLQLIGGMPNVLHIRLNELTSTPEAISMRICNFLEIPYSDKMLDGYAYNPIYPNKEILVKQ